MQVATAVTLSLAEPMTAATLGILVLGELLNARAMIGISLIFAGLVVLFVKRGARKAAPTSTVFDEVQLHGYPFEGIEPANARADAAGEPMLALDDSGIVAWVPSRGSVGASGDLAPLAHLCLPLIGRGKVRDIYDLGDQLLIAVAARIRACLRPGDHLARMGGDEFCASAGR